MNPPPSFSDAFVLAAFVVTLAAIFGFANGEWPVYASLLLLCLAVVLKGRA